MIIDISDSKFKNILSDEKLHLPIRWNGNNFLYTLHALFDYYADRINSLLNKKDLYLPRLYVDTDKINTVCRFIVEAVEHYLDGFPSKAYETFNMLMKILMNNPLKIYQKSVMEYFDDSYDRRNDKLKLYRVTGVPDNKPYDRTRVFHTPYDMRSKVSASRYSIAGYPSLYLGTSLELCCEEIRLNPYKDFALAAAFKLKRELVHTNTNIRVIELGIKPQDFVGAEPVNEMVLRRTIPDDILKNEDVKSSYLLWYPLIAACSFIRTNKNDPFAAEYIIPQLLMQWVRTEMSRCGQDGYDQLIGIRYFSCASVRSSEMGFNYVFPTSGRQKSPQLPYCSVLTRAFKLTNPKYIHEYDSISSCQWYLSRLNDYDFIR